MYKGLPGRSSRRSDPKVKAGEATGDEIEGQTQPPLPKEQPLPAVRDSTTNGSAPMRFKYQAVAKPTTPPPTTPTRIAGPRGSRSAPWLV